MKSKMGWLFRRLREIGAIALTLSFFDIGRDFFQAYLIWFLLSLWIGMIGSYIIERMDKTSKKS